MNCWDGFLLALFDILFSCCTHKTRCCRPCQSLFDTKHPIKTKKVFLNNGRRFYIWCYHMFKDPTVLRGIAMMLGLGAFIFLISGIYFNLKDDLIPKMTLVPAFWYFIPTVLAFIPIILIIGTPTGNLFVTDSDGDNARSVFRARGFVLFLLTCVFGCNLIAMRDGIAGWSNYGVKLPPSLIGNVTDIPYTNCFYGLNRGCQADTISPLLEFIAACFVSIMTVLLLYANIQQYYQVDSGTNIYEDMENAYRHLDENEDEEDPEASLLDNEQTNDNEQNEMILNEEKLRVEIGQKIDKRFETLEDSLKDLKIDVTEVNTTFQIVSDVLLKDQPSTNKK